MWSEHDGPQDHLLSDLDGTHFLLICCYFYPWNRCNFRHIFKLLFTFHSDGLYYVPPVFWYWDHCPSLFSLDCISDAQSSHNRMSKTTNWDCPSSEQASSQVHLSISSDGTVFSKRCMYEMKFVELLYTCSSRTISL